MNQPKCPKCGEELAFLVEEREEKVFYKIWPQGLYDREENSEETIRSRKYCQNCDREIKNKNIINFFTTK
jgi:predicted RNA-binding Zn-ribbon protein involved in translation (DUF1610 family)